jgi:hypothetical protein
MDNMDRIQIGEVTLTPLKNGRVQVEGATTWTLRGAEEAVAWLLAWIIEQDFRERTP